MAFNKKPLKTQDELIPYSNDLENRVEQGFNDIADYVVEQGSNYTKWASGKLECWGRISGTTGTNGYLSGNTPQNFLSGTVKYVTSNLVGYSNRSFTINAYINTNVTNLLEMWLYEGGAPKLNQSTVVDYFAIGRWK